MKNNSPIYKSFFKICVLFVNYWLAGTKRDQQIQLANTILGLEEISHKSKVSTLKKLGTSITDVEEIAAKEIEEVNENQREFGDRLEEYEQMFSLA